MYLKNIFGKRKKKKKNPGSHHFTKESRAVQ